MEEVGESQDSYFKTDFFLASTSQVQLFYIQATLFFPQLSYFTED